MSGTFPRGSRWRMTFEGVIDADGDFLVSNDLGPVAAVDPQAFASAVAERLPEPMPVWQVGDVVSISNGVAQTTLLRFRINEWACSDIHCSISHQDQHVEGDWANGAVTLLVRHGKPVSS